jgi:hypothetical protein
MKEECNNDAHIALSVLACKYLPTHLYALVPTFSNQTAVLCHITARIQNKQYKVSLCQVSIIIQLHHQEYTILSLKSRQFLLVKTLIFPAISEPKISLSNSRKYCYGLLKALIYGTSKSRVTRSTTELRLISSEGLNNHAKRGTIEDIDSQATHTETGFRYNG